MAIEGTIRGFRGSWHSGLASLIVATDDGDVFSLPCDNAPTVRCLDTIRPGFLAPGHTVRVERIVGLRARFHLDDLGLMLAAIEPLGRKG